MRADFTLTVDLAVDRERLHGFLCDLRSSEPLHPLIESIEEIDPAPELPNARRWRVVDRVPVGPIRMRAVYLAALDPVSETEVRGHAWQRPGVRLTTVYSLSDPPDASGTRLEERVFVRAPFGLQRFVVSRARSAHAVTLERMKALFESEGDRGSSA